MALGIGISASFGLIIGLLIGILPLGRSFLAQLVAVLSMIPPLALLQILFIFFGLGELSKVVLIVIGTLPFIIRDLSQRTLEVPQELLVKAQTLGASSWVITLRVALPQVMPRLIQAVHLSLGPAWLFLIAAEAIAAELSYLPYPGDMVTKRTNLALSMCRSMRNTSPIYVVFCKTTLPLRRATHESFDHHEVVMATTALPSMIWFAVVASGPAAAIWRNWRRK